jgi:hypothetical protein
MHFYLGDIMITLGRLAIFGVLAVLTGCGGTYTPCPKPGGLSGTLQTCWYQLHVLNVDAERNVVTAKTHPAIQAIGPDDAYYGGAKDEIYTFRVVDIDKMTKDPAQLRADPKDAQNPKIHVFTSLSNLPFLQLVPEDTFHKAKSEIMIPSSKKSSQETSR